MSKSTELRRLYEKIELESTQDRMLLSRLRDGNASNDEIDELLELVMAQNEGARILDGIKEFENSLIKDFEIQLDILKALENDNNIAAHIEDEVRKEREYANMKKRYKKAVSNAEELIEAIKIAYFQISNYQQYEDQLYEAKDPLLFLE